MGVDTALPSARSCGSEGVGAWAGARERCVVRHVGGRTRAGARERCVVRHTPARTLRYAAKIAILPRNLAFGVGEVAEVSVRWGAGAVSGFGGSRRSAFGVRGSGPGTVEGASFLGPGRRRSSPSRESHQGTEWLGSPMWRCGKSRRGHLR